MTFFVRDFAVTVVIYGVAAFLWFGWAQEAPPARWRLPLGVGAALGVLFAITGGVLAWQNWGPDSVLATGEARRTFGIICGIEFGLAGVGSAVLGVTKRPKWISAWIAAVVGAHFVPLASVLADPGLIGLAVLILLAVAAAVVLHLRRGTTLSALVGLGTGVVFLIYATRAVLLVVTAA